MSSSTPNSASVRRAYAGGINGQIHYRTAGPAGTRSPLLLIHPSPSSSTVFEAFMAEMGRDRSVIAPDLPGYGMSDPPRAAQGIGEYAAAMLALEAKLGLGLFDVMGYHTGGLVAAEMARQQPRSVRKLVMIAALLLDPSEREKMLARMSEMPPDQRAQAFPQAWQGFKTGFWRMGNDGIRDEIRIWNLYLEAQRNPDISGWGHRAAAGYDLAGVLPQLTQPVLVLNPEDDLAPYTKRAAALLRNGRVHDLPGWTHGFLDAHTSETATIVRGFLDG